LRRVGTGRPAAGGTARDRRGAPGLSLPRSSPEQQGVASAGVIEFLDAAASADIELHSLMIMRHHQVVAEGWWHPYSADQPNLLYSVSKSFTAAAAGIALAEGMFNLDDSLVSHLPEYAPADIDERSRRTTIRDALTMATGHEHDLMQDAVREGGDWLNSLFCNPPEQEPGEVFCYNQLASNAVARIIQRHTGMRLVDYLDSRLFAPLGITEHYAFADPMGNDWGSHGLALRTESVAGFGELLLQQGTWADRQVIPSDWVTLATSLQMPNDSLHRPTEDPVAPADWTQGYGFHFWRSTHGYRGDGAYGQFCIVLPEQDSVVVMTALSDKLQEQLDLVWTHLLPALGARTTPERDRELACRLGDLAIPTPTSEAIVQGGSFVRADMLSHSDPDPAAPNLHRVDLHIDSPTAVTLELHLDDRAHRLPVGVGQWLPGDWPALRPVPFSSAGGWVDGVFSAHLRMIQTPHVLVLTLDSSDASLSAAWTRSWLGHGNDPADYAPVTTRPTSDRERASHG
jgi:CubicO group peptidase (beta-lactamase class C family)